MQKKKQKKQSSVCKLCEEMLEDTTLETANGECLPALRMFVKRCRTLPSNVWSLLLSSRPYSWMFEFRCVERRRRVLLNSLLGENKQCKNHKLSNTFKKDGKRAVISSRLGVSVFVNSSSSKATEAMTVPTSLRQRCFFNLLLWQVFGCPDFTFHFFCTPCDLVR